MPDNFGKTPYGERLDDNGERHVVEAPLLEVNFGGGKDCECEIPVLSGIKKLLSWLRNK